MTEIIRKVQAKFVAADIYHHLMQGKVHLYWIEEGMDRLGFVILSQYDSGYEEMPTLVIDHLWLTPGLDVFAEAIAAGHDLANKLGVERIEFNSARLGWGKRVKELGFEPAFVTYHFQVNRNG
jgi:hypothetical protein